MGHTETIPAPLWTRRGKAIVSKNLKRWRKSPGLGTVSRELGRCVVEYGSDGGVTYDKELYKVIRAHLLSEGFALNGDPCITEKTRR